VYSFVFFVGNLQYFVGNFHTMSPDTIFQLCSGIAVLGWLILIIASPLILEIDKFLVGIVIAILCIVYLWLIVSSFAFEDIKNFGSLNGVMEIFKDKTLVTAGWVHYLAFDLLTGCWIKRNSARHGIPHLVIIPVLLLTFLLGPVGLFLYLFIRWGKTRRYFATNYN